MNEGTQDLNELFKRIEKFSDQYRFFLAQLGQHSWQVLFQRMDETAEMGNVSAKGDTPGQAIRLALALVETQD